MQPPGRSAALPRTPPNLAPPPPSRRRARPCPARLRSASARSTPPSPPARARGHAVTPLTGVEQAWGRHARLALSPRLRGGPLADDAARNDAHGGDHATPALSKSLDLLDLWGWIEEPLRQERMHGARGAWGATGRCRRQLNTAGTVVGSSTRAAVIRHGCWSARGACHRQIFRLLADDSAHYSATLVKNHGTI